MLRELRAFRETATEKSLRAFSNQQVYKLADGNEAMQTKLTAFLTARGFGFRTVQQQMDQH